MTIQVGLTGPPHVPDHRLRVWSDRTGVPVRVVLDPSGGAIPGATITPRPVPPPVAGHPRFPRQVVEIANLPPDTPVRVEIGGESCRAITPPAPSGELRVLLGSCLWLREDRGRVAAACERLNALDRPHLRLHAGDQLYLDAGSLPRAPTELERTLRRYRDHWEADGFARFLRAGASLFAPDDHDYWNDYPYAMPHLSRSRDGQWVAHAQAARLAYAGYQALGNPEGRFWFELDLGLVSLFVMDTRSDRGTDRRNPPSRLFDPVQRDALRAWSAGLTKPGILLSAMPLFQKPVGKFLGVEGDHNLLAWEDDARAIWQAVEAGPWSILVLAGDIHEGRALRWMSTHGGRNREHYEIIGSPLSLLNWPLAFSLFSRRKVSPPPEGLLLGPALGRRDPASLYFGTSTDHFVLLRLRDAGQAGVAVQATALQTGTAAVPAAEQGTLSRCSMDFHVGRYA